MNANKFRGFPVMAEKPTEGFIALTEPYKPGFEDNMLLRVINDCIARRTPFALVWQTARKELGGWSGISVWKSVPIPPKPKSEKAKIGQS